MLVTEVDPNKKLKLVVNQLEPGDNAVIDVGRMGEDPQLCYVFYYGTENGMVSLENPALFWGDISNCTLRVVRVLSRGEVVKVN